MEMYRTYNKKKISLVNILKATEEKSRICPIRNSVVIRVHCTVYWGNTYCTKGGDHFGNYRIINDRFYILEFIGGMPLKSTKCLRLYFS